MRDEKGRFIKGHNPWTKGVKLSFEHKQRISQAHMGRTHLPHSEETKRKIGLANSISKLGTRLSEEHKKKIGLANSVSQLGRKLSEETKSKISISNKGKKASSTAFKKGFTPWNKGTKVTKYCNDCGCEIKNFYARYCKKCSLAYRDFKEIGLKGLIKQQNMKEPTSIEKTLYDYLLLKGILFEKQKLINGKFIVDAYIPSLNLVIEADGNYWHGLDRVVKKDKAENAYLVKCGFSLLRLTEEEIKSGKFKERMVF